jgi:hypothetical protein
MRKGILFLGVVGLLAFAGRGLSPVQVQAAAEKVGVCHFGGHDGDFAGPAGDRRLEIICERRGGNVITVSVNALSAHVPAQVP